MTDTPTRILLIRHGLNDFVRQGLLAGRMPAVHLNEEGRAQAIALAQRLGSTQLAAIYSSPLDRTRETAAPLAAHLNLTVHCLDGLQECETGAWTGQALDALRQTEEWRQVQMQPSRFRFPGGESMAEVQARMVSTLEALLAAHPAQTIAVISHSDPIKSVIAYYAGMPLDLFQRLEIAPASISELEFMPQRPRLARLNDCAHISTDSSCIFAV